MIKIGVKNFQSIEKAGLEADGFTVITGDSNLGKSALIRAASSVVFGSLGDHYIRRGEPLFQAGLRFEDGLRIKWQKVGTGKKKPGRETFVDIDGELFTKIGRDHFKLTQGYGFLEIPTQAGNLRPQVAFQFDKAFLMDIPETATAEVFKVLGRGDVVAKARDTSKGH